MTQQALFKLELTIEQTNGILQILGNAPYIQSVNLINLIQTQVGPQVRELQGEPNNEQ